MPNEVIVVHQRVLTMPLRQYCDESLFPNNMLKITSAPNAAQHSIQAIATLMSPEATAAQKCPNSGIAVSPRKPRDTENHVRAHTKFFARAWP